MQLIEATALIATERLQQKNQSTWADLGCGSGLFTEALSMFLAENSTIYAVDKISLQHLPNHFGKVVIRKTTLDFEREKFSFPPLDGILMSNALHYVKDQMEFINKAEKQLKETGCFLIVEYDTDSSNPWVPYPLSFPSLKNLFIKAGYASVKKLNERPSVYNRAMMYAAIIERQP